MDILYEKMAKVLLEYSLKIKKNEFLLINTDDPGLEFSKIISMEAIKKGVNTYIHFDSSDIKEYMIRYQISASLSYINPNLLKMYEEADAQLFVRGNNNSLQFSNLDPKRVIEQRKSRAAISRMIVKNHDSKKSRWCISQIPTHAQAREAGMS